MNQLLCCELDVLMDHVELDVNWWIDHYTVINVYIYIYVYMLGEIERIEIGHVEIELIASNDYISDEEQN